MNLRALLPQRERIFIFPTLYGFMYGGGIIVCLMSGAIYSNNLAYLLCFFLVALFIIGMHQSHSNMRNLSFERMQLELTTENSKGLGKIWLKSQNSEGHANLQIHSDNGIDNWSSTIDRIHKKAFSVHRIQVKAGPRGVRRFSKVKVSSRFPFGLFYVWRNFKIEEDFFVYPRAAGSEPLPMTPGDGDTAIAKASSQGEDFTGHDRYVPGENQKRIDWKAFARGRPLMVKIFESGQQRRVHLELQKNLQKSESDVSDPVEAYLRQMSQWIENCEKDNILYSLTSGETSWPADIGHRHRVRCLKELAAY